MNAAIVAVENGVSIHQPDAATLARWASERHEETCPQCRRGDERCPAGDQYHASTQPDRSWITDENGA